MRFRIFDALAKHDDEWIALTRAGAVIDRGPDLEPMRLRWRERRPAVTLLRVPPSGRTPRRSEIVV
jgi:hypothetical protein